MAAAGSDDKENRTSAFVVDLGETGAGPPIATLQDRFAQYRKDKAKAFRLRAGAKRASRTAAEMVELRKRFVDRCHHYMGVPYKKKYFEPGTPEYDAPLFLDCCGLVRRVCWDMQEALGFRLGSWNQAYQWDTLANAQVDNHTLLQPGDLVFYAGDYTNPKAKAQKHRMVHVEVFLGGKTGRGTIGARWKKGIVSLFDDFAFKPQSWDNITFHFCKIDPWLNGECLPKHSHLWRMRSLEWMSNARSVFSAAELAQDHELVEDADADSDDEAEAQTAEGEAETNAAAASTAE